MGKQRKTDNDFRITELQQTDEVTGSSLLVEVDGQVILIDYGMIQNADFDVSKAYDVAKEKKKVPIDKLTAVILTHSHADHVGNLGILSRSDIDFKGKIYATELCAALTREILYDSAYIMCSETERYNNNNKDKKKISPLYTKDEVDTLMNLLSTYLKNEVKTLHEENVKLNAIGNIDELPSKCVEELKKGIELTKNNTGCNLNLALNYGGRMDIKNAVIDIIKDVKDGKINIDEINENTISNHLSTKSIPDPDLVIRTSGEERLSNFLLWEVAYSEFYITNIHWPDFDEKELQKAIYTYQSRDRRFGGIK